MKKTLKTALMGLMIMGTSSLAQAQTMDEEKEAINSVILEIFDGMREANTDKIIKHVLPETPLDRIAPGKPVSHGKLQGWIDGVANMQPGQADEQVYDVVIQVEGPLATAWTPFSLAINGEIRSCGVNHFTFVKQESGWKVAYLIDTHTPDKCDKYR